MKSTYLISEKDRLYFITGVNVLDKAPTLSEKAENVLASLKKQKDDPDLLWFSGLFCTGDSRNGNGDGFKEDDLIASAETPIFKYANWLHDDKTKIGFILHSEYNSDEKYINVVGIVWNGTPYDRKYANKVKSGFNNNALGLSMECVPKTVECSECNRVFAFQPEELYCEHLKSRRINGTTRWLKQPLFLGVGFIPTSDDHAPADKDAWVKEIANLKHVKGGVQNMEITQDALDKMVSDARKALEDKVSSLEATIVERNKSITALEGTIAEKDESIVALTAERDELKAKVDKYMEDETERQDALFNNRVAELKDSGCDLPDDLQEILKEKILDDEGYKTLASLFKKDKKGEGRERFYAARTDGELGSKLRTHMKGKK